jgi:hypothetical protein
MALRVPFAMARPESPLVMKLGEGPPVSISRDWYVLLYNIYNAVTQGLPQAEAALTVGASPFIYQAIIRGQVIITGGTVSAIAFSRDGITYYNTGQTAGTFQMDAKDYLRITHTGAPTATVFPM